MIGIIGIGIAMAILITVYCVTVYNKLNVAEVKIKESDSGIDVALNKRYDVLVKLIDTVKGYAKYEKETLEQIVKLRKNMTISEKVNAANAISEEISRLQLEVENYPELKASQNYVILQKGIIEVEEHLQAARRLYNSNISIYNQIVVSFPSSLVASANGKVQKEFFVVEEAKKQDVKIDV